MKRLFISITAAALALLLCAGLAQPGFAEGSAPVAENLELNTYRNVSVGGKLKAYDPDDDVVSFEITTQPVKGSIELEEDGSFVYTPNQDKKGKDYFGYKAMDEKGNCSQEATVIIRISKQKEQVSYPDVDGTAGEYYAVALSESGIFTGEKIGGIYCFCPDKEVSRGEFLSMCMMAAGEPVISGVMNTGYADDEDIPGWMKGFVSTAAMRGIDAGTSDGESTVFQADAPITRTEAALMLNRALAMNNVNYLELDATLGEEEAQACANLSATGILYEGTHVPENLTRLEAAELLVNALRVVGSR